jgi:large subunit ribosomal protein L6
MSAAKYSAKFGNPAKRKHTVSRVGNLPIGIPGGVKFDIKPGTVSVTGPKGTLTETFDPKIEVVEENGEIVVRRPNDRPDMRAKHGLVRALIQNMVVGVTDGYTRTLEIQGVGYRAAMQGKNLTMTLGFSHPVEVTPPPGIEFAVDGQTTVKISGISKQLVGQVAANVRAWRKPEPYKGKGIRYQGEFVRRKAGKAGGK